MEETYIISKLLLNLELVCEVLTNTMHLHKVKSHKMDSLGALSTTVGDTFCYMVRRHHAATLYIKS